ncbi:MULTISPECIES: hypothetical protein [Nocardia]|uniref:hypothetical protein n=1 Tax=Nocardia TaxID=1817 RepID=UPI002453AB5E|nr:MULTISPECIES: hypothetical protein [Nocardia]
MTRYITPDQVHAALIQHVGPVPMPADHETFCAYLDRRAAACLEVTENIANLAERINNDGDTDAAAELLTNAQQFMAEYNHIVSMRLDKS